MREANMNEETGQISEPLQLFTTEQQKEIKANGRPRLFNTPDKLWEQFTNYIEWNGKQTQYYKTDFIKAGNRAGELINVPLIPMLMIETFCSYLGITNDTLMNYEKGIGYEKFFATVSRIKNYIQEDQIKRAALDLVNPNIVAMLNNMKQRTDITTNDNDMPVVSISFAKPDE